MRLARTFAGTALAAVVAVLSTASTGPTEAAGASSAPSRTSSPNCGNTTYARPTGGTYTCTFVDSFSGSSLDRTKWAVQKTATSGFTSGDRQDCYVDDPDNVSVSNGNLRLTARVEAAAFTCSSPYGAFTTNRTTGSVVSWDKFAQAYGRFEFRAKFPAVNVPGVHSALWMSPQKNTYGIWPNSGEIDVAEWFSRVVDHVYPSVHYSGEDTTKSTGYDCVVSTASSTFHTYAVEWTSTVMKFYYDGKLCYSHSWTPAAPLVAPQPFDQPFVVAMTQAWGQGWNAFSSTTTPKSATMYVDWVKAWK